MLMMSGRGDSSPGGLLLQEVFDEPMGQILVSDQALHVLGFDPQDEVITRWIP